MALCQINKIVVWTAQWLQELKILFLKSVQISIIKNNLKTNDLMKNFKHHVHTKYIDVQYHYIWKMIELKMMIINHIFFFQNATNIFIKSLNKTKFINDLKLLRFAVWKNMKWKCWNSPCFHPANWLLNLNES